MIDVQSLSNFLVKAKISTYASGNSACQTKEKDSSTSFFFEENNYRYHDNYFGGEPFGGREVVFLNNKPIYIMTYYGSVDNSFSDFKLVYQFLTDALKLVSASAPFRGPSEYAANGFVYKNTHSGNIEKFYGQEQITKNGIEIYQAKYTGGIVNQR